MGKREKLNPIEKTEYDNATVFEYENTMVGVASLPTTEDYYIELKTVSEDHSVRAIHRIEEDNIVVTGIRISPEAAVSIMIGLSEQLKKGGFI